ncbi:MAG: helix-turn-helix transcriptional regulator [Telmatospirillum sp.]|nr:helix-turn-helix transcriptional regulator [Telmatospirillum sp.]
MKGMSTKSLPSQPLRRHRRSRAMDEGGTRTLLLEAAGTVFAECGFDRATGRAICDRASVNPAAINYHFGGMEELYLAVLIEAHQRLVTEETLSEVAAAAFPPTDKLRIVISYFVRAAFGAGDNAWAFRVLGREIIMPTPMFEALRVREIMPKIGHVRQIVAQLMELPEDHPAVTRSFVSTMAPCMMMLIADHEIFGNLFPRIAGGAGDGLDPLIDHLLRFALAGLEVAKRAAM